MQGVQRCSLFLLKYSGLLSVFVSVCMSVGHKREPYKNSRTNRHVVWVVDAGGSKGPRIRWEAQISLSGKGQFLGPCPAPMYSIGTEYAEL